MYQGFATLIAVSAMIYGLGYYYFPDDNIPGLPPDNVLSERCSYDTRILCRVCFHRPSNCSVFTGKITFNKPKDEFMKDFNARSVTLGLVARNLEVIINNLNRNESVEKLQYSVCEELNTTDDCFWWDKEPYIDAVRQRVLSTENRTKGIVFCPPNDYEGLTRFVQQFELKELLTLIMIATNSQSLMVQLLSGHNLPVPTFILREGFMLVERYEGEPLRNFYDTTLKLRLQIANELIGAFIRFNAGVNNFTFVPMNTHPDNIYVEIYPKKVPKVTFTELSDVTVVDENSKIHISGPQVVNCSIRHGEQNLYRACQILLEDDFGTIGEGFLHNKEKGLEFKQLKAKLQATKNCGRPNHCEHRQKGLERIQKLISKILRTYFN